MKFRNKQVTRVSRERFGNVCLP